MIRKWRIATAGSLDCGTFLVGKSYMQVMGEGFFWFEEIDKNAGFRQHC